MPELNWRSWRLAALILVGVLVGVAMGFWIGRTSVPDIGASPAIDIAREVGVAIPKPQLPAFSDGIVTLAEMEEAYDRFVKCVGDSGLASGFSSTLDQDGSVSISIQQAAGDALWREVERCRIEHLEATRAVFVSMQRLTRDPQYESLAVGGVATG